MTPQIIIQKFKEPFKKIVRVTLRTKLMIAFFLTVIVCLAVVFVLSQRVIKHRFDEIAKEQITDALSRIDNELKITGNEITGKLEKIAQITELKRKMLMRYESSGFDYLGLSNQLIDLMQSTGLDILEITDHDGKVLASAHEPGKIGSIKSDDVFLQTALTGKNAQGISIENLVSGSYLALKSSVPIYHRGEIIGVLTGGYLMNSEFIQRLKRVGAVDLGLVQGNNLVVSTLVDSQGKPITQLHLSAEFLSSIRSSKIPLMQRFVLNQTEFSIGGMPLITGNKSVGILLVAVSQEKLQQTVADLRRNIIWFGFFGMCIALLVAYLIAKRITYPLDKLVEGSVAIAKGDYDIQIPITSKDELGALVSSYNYMAKELRENREKLITAMRVAEWQEVAKRIAHEIKNPLTPIQLSIQNLQQSYNRKAANFDEVLQESTQTILEEVENLYKIVNAFSEFARMPKPQPEWIELSEVIESTVTLYSSGQDQIQFKVKVNEQIPKIYADPEQLRRAFSNLIKNAIDAMPNGGTLTISVQPTILNERPAVQISFADTGEGMTQETKSKLFMPYFSTKQKGTGLGLSMVDRIVSDHGGKIEVVSEVNQGSTFIIVIPVYNEAFNVSKE